MSKRKSTAATTTKGRRNPNDDSYFQSPQNVKRYNDFFKGRQVLIGRNVNFDFMTQEGLPFEALLGKLEWIPMFRMHEVMYPILDRVFYTTLVSGHSEEEGLFVEAVVKGVKFRLDTATLASILGVPNTGNEVFVSKSWPSNLEDFNELEATQFIFGDNVIDLKKSENLPPINKLLHHMIAHIVLPKAGHMNLVSRMEIIVMWHILNEIPLNLPYIILKNMVKTAGAPTTLPYGMLLTKVFKHFGISLKGEEFVKLMITDTFDGASLSRMHYRKTRTGWVVDSKQAAPHVGGSSQAPVDAVDANEDDEAEDEGSSGVNQLLRELTQKMDFGFAAINSRLDSMYEQSNNFHAQVSSRLEGLQNQINGLSQPPSDPMPQDP